VGIFEERSHYREVRTEEIARRLVALCREQKWEIAQRELYADDAISREPHSSPTAEQKTKGLPGIIEKGRKFVDGIETLHSLEISDPVVAESSFACTIIASPTGSWQPVGLRFEHSSARRKLPPRTIHM